MMTTRRTFLTSACILCGFCQAPGQDPPIAPAVTAIDILLAPDSVMMDRAKTANARLRTDYPKGFALDATHAPHVTIIQRFVRTSDLDKVYAAVAKVLKDENPTSWELKAKGYYDIPVEKLGLAGIVIEPTADLLRLQQKLIDAVAPFNSDKATAEAFALRPDGKIISQAQPTIDYVTAFVPKSSGKNYNPHVTIGLGTREFVDKLKAEPFQSFTFKARAAAVYKLGEFGTAQTLLWTSAPADPLPSWNDGKAKRSIVEFVAKVAKEGSPDFVPVAERIAVFDNDGTLWPENPLPFQLAFIFDELKRRVPNDPRLAGDPMVKVALAGDVAKLLEGDHHDGLMRVVALTHAGMTTDEFRDTVETWLASARHPKYGKPYDQLAYQPMQELLRYLRANGFKTFIVSGGGADFMRVWAERVYGIPPEQIVGSTATTKFELRDSGPVLVKTLDHLFVDDKSGKPVGIHQFIGRRPIAAFGNSDGDHAMLQYTTFKNPRPSFGLIVHHNDAEREYAYDREAGLARLDKVLDEAPKRGWTVVSMKDDWRTIFPAAK
jgi:phosphoglycolate phosphatase-like HAD superfamily hydrolase